MSSWLDLKPGLTAVCFTKAQPDNTHLRSKQLRLLSMRHEVGLLTHLFLCLFYMPPLFLSTWAISTGCYQQTNSLQTRPRMASVLSCVKTPHAHRITSHSAGRSLHAAYACYQTNQGVDTTPNVHSSHPVGGRRSCTSQKIEIIRGCRVAPLALSVETTLTKKKNNTH